MTKKRIVILGAAGMLGYAMLRTFVEAGHDVAGSVRAKSIAAAPYLVGFDIRDGIYVEKPDTISSLLTDFQPHFVFNCIAQKSALTGEERVALFHCNATFPRWLEGAVEEAGAKLVHFSTDSVFDGAIPPHNECDAPKPLDLYGVSKCLGEVNGPSALTIRTSMIGRSIGHGSGLVDWAVKSDAPQLQGYSKAIFSGMPVNIIAEFLRVHVLNCVKMPSGVFHLASAPIDKLTLLRLVLDAWGKSSVALENSDAQIVDRTLSSTRTAEFGSPYFPDWPEMVSKMRSFYGSIGL